MAFGKGFNLNRSDAAAAALSGKYVFCALVSDDSVLAFDPKFCSDEIGQTCDSLMAALAVCKAPASRKTGIAGLLSDTTIMYCLMRVSDGRWIAIKRKTDNKGFAFYDPMGGKSEKFGTSEELMKVLASSYGVDEQTLVIAVSKKTE